MKIIHLHEHDFRYFDGSPEEKEELFLEQKLEVDKIIMRREIENIPHGPPQ